MVMVAPVEADGGISLDSRFALRPGGAESNVAIHLSRLGHATEWVGQLGDDPFGAIILDYLRATGVDVGRVVVDPTAPTGVYFKDSDGQHTDVYYYRRGSAASRMSPDLVDRLVDEPPAVLHLTGVTAALSAGCQALVERLVIRRGLPATRVTFDVNYRPALWPVVDAAPVLLGLAASADVVFVGLDEARTLWGCRDAQAVRDLLPGPAEIVVKNGAVEATSIGTEGTVSVPAPRVDVVELVGAGDAFAAGWLSGLLRGVSALERLQLGHALAGHVLRTTFDDIELPADLRHGLPRTAPTTTSGAG
ncbi:sugar kinase [Cellulomonas sp. zg-ZUI40]|nr:sugar kinase [Cellulomonas dongxiuzhuiae]